MELTPAGQLRRSSQLHSPVNPEAKPVRPSSMTAEKTDTLTLSQAALAFVEEQKRLREEQEIRAQMEDSEDGGMADMLDEQLKSMQQCMKIASRIMAGDKVPPQDMKYLMEHDIKLYQMAMAARTIPSKKKPKEWDSALEEEEPSDGSSTEGETDAAVGETASASASDSGGDL